MWRINIGVVLAAKITTSSAHIIQSRPCLTSQCSGWGKLMTENCQIGTSCYAECSRCQCLSSNWLILATTWQILQIVALLCWFQTISCNITLILVRDQSFWAERKGNFRYYLVIVEIKSICCSIGLSDGLLLVVLGGNMGILLYIQILNKCLRFWANLHFQIDLYIQLSLYSISPLKTKGHIIDLWYFFCFSLFFHRVRIWRFL